MLHGPWYIELFGRLRARAGDRCVDRFRTEKTGALLAFLAYYGDDVPRERLADLLWPEVDVVRARMSLRTSLSSLRRQLEPPGTTAGMVLRSSTACVGLRTSSFITDVEQFKHLLNLAESAPDDSTRVLHWTGAVELYRGELLAGYFDDWILPERERLAATYAATLRKLVRHLTANRDLPRALGFAQSAVASSPQSESAHSDLIRIYLALGRFEAAKQAWETLERILRDDLEQQPSPAAMQLAREVAARIVGRSGRGGPILPPLTFATPTPATIPTVRLPLQLTGFFGRHAELRRLGGLLIAEGEISAKPARLVTITGPGGIGKTRLAIEFAKRLSTSESIASVFVELADLLDPQLIPRAVTQAMDLEPSPDGDPTGQIVQAVDGPTLLVLDNFEQLRAAGAGWVLTLLSRAPHIRCLVTSRQRLAIPGERELPLCTLETPEDTESPECLLTFPSIELFVDRAQLARPDFQITPGNARSVCELCRGLDGVPLAIELAAARSQICTVGQMVSMLESRFDLLRSNRKDREARHQSLWAAIDWSYSLLSPELQRFFADLSIFRGSFTAEAAAGVCCEHRSVDYLAQLRGHSLVVTVESPDAIRVRLLESLREFANTKLTTEEKSTLQARHLDYYLDLAETAEAGLTGPDQAVWFSRLAADRDNIRASLERALSSGKYEPVARIGAAIWRFWWIHGHAEEGLRWLEPVIADGLDALKPNLAGRALHAAGTLAWASNQMEDAERFHREALHVRRESGDMDGSARSLGSLGNVLRERGQSRAALECYSESLALFREIGDNRLIATSLLNLGTLAEGINDSRSAQECYEESLALYRALRDQHSIAIALSNLADVLCGLADFAGAAELMRECMGILTKLDSKSKICFLLTHSAPVCMGLGHSETAVELLAASWTHLSSQGVGIFPTFKAAYDRYMESARACLDRATFDRAYKVGASLSLPEAIDRFYSSVRP